MKIAPLIGFPGRALTGTTIKQNLTDADIQLKTLSAIDSVFNPDIIFCIMDLSIEAESLGAKIAFAYDESPSVIEHPVQNEADLDKLAYSGLPVGRMKVFLDVVKGFKKQSGKELAASVVGPYTLTGLLMGAKAAAMSIITRKELLHKVLEFSTELIMKYAVMLKESGTDYIVILEPTSVILSPAQFNMFSAPYIEKIAPAIGGNCVLHICGSSTHLFDEFAKLKAIMGLSLDSVVDLKTAYEKTNKTVIGNISPVTVCFGTKDEISTAASGLLEQMEGIDSFIFSTGCDLPPETPKENILHLINFIKGYSG